MKLSESATIQRVKKSQPGALIAGSSVALVGMLTEFVVCGILRPNGITVWPEEYDLKAVVLLTAGIEWLRRTIAYYGGTGEVKQSPSA